MASLASSVIHGLPLNILHNQSLQLPYKYYNLLTIKYILLNYEREHNGTRFRFIKIRRCSLHNLNPYGDHFTGCVFYSVLNRTG